MLQRRADLRIEDVNDIVEDGSRDPTARTRHHPRQITEGHPVTESRRRLSRGYLHDVDGEASSGRELRPRGSVDVQSDHVVADWRREHWGDDLDAVPHCGPFVAGS